MESTLSGVEDEGANSKRSPDVPIKTYQWEDVRRDRKKGKYPWTYITKQPFSQTQEEAHNSGEMSTPIESPVFSKREIIKPIDYSNPATPKGPLSRSHTPRSKTPGRSTRSSSVSQDEEIVLNTDLDGDEYKSHVIKPVDYTRDDGHIYEPVGADPGPEQLRQAFTNDPNIVKLLENQSMSVDEERFYLEKMVAKGASLDDDYTKWSRGHEYEPIADPSNVQTIPTIQIDPVIKAEPEDFNDLTTVVPDPNQFIRIPLDEELVVPADGTVEDEVMSGDEEIEDEIDNRFLNYTPTTIGSRTDCDFNTSQFDSSALEELPLNRDGRRAVLATEEDIQTQNFKDRMKSGATRIRTKIQGLRARKDPSGSDKPVKTKVNRYNIIERARQIERPRFTVPKAFNRPRLSSVARHAPIQMNTKLPKGGIFVKARDEPNMTKRFSYDAAQRDDGQTGRDEPDVTQRNDESDEPSTERKKSLFAEKIASRLPKMPDMPRLSMPDIPRLSMPDIRKISMPKISEINFPIMKKSDNSEAKKRINFGTFPKRKRKTDGDDNAAESGPVFKSKLLRESIPDWITLPRRKKTEKPPRPKSPPRKLTHFSSVVEEVINQPLVKARTGKRKSIPNYITTDNPDIIIIPLRDYSKDEPDLEVEEKEVDVTVEEKDVTIEEKNVTVEDKDVTIKEKDVTIKEKDVPVQDKEPETPEEKPITSKFYLNDAIQEAFTKPVSSLAEIIEPDVYDVPRRRSQAEIRSETKPYVTEQTKLKSDDYHTFPKAQPVKPKRPERRQRSKESKDGKDVVHVSTYSIDYIDDGQDYAMEVPSRRKRSTKSLKDFHVQAVEVNPMQSLQELRPSPTSAPLAPKRRLRSSQSRSTIHSIMDSDFTNQDIDSLLSEDRIVDEPLETIPGYAKVQKPKTEPPTRRKRKSKTGIEPPTRPQRKYSTLPTRKPPLKRSSNKENTEYIEIEDEEGMTQRLKSGDVVEKMKTRPLPAPPRPPRKSLKSRKVLTDANQVEGRLAVQSKTPLTSSSESIVKGRLLLSERVDIIMEIEGDVRREETPDVMEVEISTQTDPLPDNFICEEVIEEENDIIIIPRCRGSGNADRTIESERTEPEPEQTDPEPIAEEPTLQKYLQDKLSALAAPSAPFPEDKMNKIVDYLEKETRDETKLERSQSVTFFQPDSEQLRPPIGILEQQSYDRPSESSIDELELPAVRRSRAKTGLINRSASDDQPTRSFDVPDAIQQLHVGELNLNRLVVSELVASKLTAGEIEGTWKAADERTELADLQRLVRELMAYVQEKASEIRVSHEQGTNTELSAEEPVTCEVPSTSEEPVTCEVPSTSRPSTSQPMQFPHICVYPQMYCPPGGSCSTSWPPSMNAGPSTSASSNQPSSSTQSTSLPQQIDDQSIPELSTQLLRACSNSAKRSVQQVLSDLSTRLNTGDEKQDARTAMIVIVVLMAGLVLLTSLNQEPVHHHHWEFFNPPDSNRPA